MDYIFNIKQVGLITENSERAEKLVKSLYKKGYHYDRIMDMTGLPRQTVLKSLYDEVITYQNDTDKIWKLLYRDLWQTNFIKKEEHYGDGSSIYLNKDSLSGTINFNYETKNGNKIYGYATLFWDGEPVLPVEGQEFEFENGEFSYYDIDMGDYYDEIKKYIPKKINIRGIVELFNQGYFKVLKNVLDKMEVKYLDEL